MNDQMKEITQELKNNAQESKDKFLKEVGNVVGDVLEEKIDNNEIKNIITTLQKFIGDNPDKFLENVHNTVQNAFEDNNIIDKYKIVVQEIIENNKVELKEKLSSLETNETENCKMVQTLQSVLTQEEINSIKTKIDNKNTEIENIAKNMNSFHSAIEELCNKSSNNNMESEILKESQKGVRKIEALKRKIIILYLLNGFSILGIVFLIISTFV